MKNITNVKLKIAASLFIVVYTVVLYHLPISCPVLEITGVRCLGCGMTRAWLSVLRLDFAAAFSYHAMFWAVPVLYAALWLDGNIFKNKKVNNLFYMALLCGFLGNWMFHQFA